MASICNVYIFLYVLRACVGQAWPARSVVGCDVVASCRRNTGTHHCIGMKLDSGLALDIRERIGEDDAYFLDISSRWSGALQDAYRS